MTPVVVAVALVVGLTLGTLGAGGSILTVPALVHLLGQDARTATTGSLLIVGTTALIGLLPHARAGRVRLLQGLAFGVLGVGGAWLGSLLSVQVDPRVLLVAFAVLMLVVASLMTRRRRSARRAAAAGLPPAPSDGREWDGRSVALLVAAATGVGLLTGFFGVGGGFAVVPALVLVMRMPMQVAVGTSLVVIVVNSVSAFVSRLGNEVELDWTVLGTFTAVAVVGSLIGGRVAGRLDAHKMSLAFTVLLVAVALYTGTQAVLDLV